MRVTLHSATQKIAFFAAALMAMAVYLVIMGRSYRAEQLSSRLDAMSLRSALLLEPDNAGYAHDLGRYLFLAQDAQSATPYLQRAVDLNQFVARFWFDLAAAYYVAGDLPGQQHAIEQATASDPRTPEVAWEAANFYLVQGRTDDALQQLGVVLQNTSEPLRPALQLGWRTTHNIDKVLAITPNKPAALLELLQVMISNQRIDEAEAVWQRLASLHQWVDPKQLASWIGFLVLQGRPEDANNVWQQLIEMDPELKGYASPGNLLSNGGFERELLDGGFDWQFQANSEVNFALDTTQLYGGTRSLRITFPGSPVQDTGLLQWVAVRPDSTYSFSAYVRSEELLTSSGPRFEIVEPYTRERLFLADDILGSNSWMRVTGDFHTGSKTKLVALRIVRVPANSVIKGQMWIDDVSVTQR